MLAGAALVGVGTALFYDPLVCLAIADHLEQYRLQISAEGADDWVGKLGAA